MQIGHRKKPLNGCLSNAWICHPINGQTKQYRPKWSAHKWTRIHADNGIAIHIKMGKCEKNKQNKHTNRIEIEWEKKDNKQIN